MEEGRHDDSKRLTSHMGVDLPTVIGPPRFDVEGRCIIIVLPAENLKRAIVFT